MRLHHTFIALSLNAVAALSTSSRAQEKELATPALGETISDIRNSCWYVFQDKDNNYWFGTDGNGVCRYDGKTLTRFTTLDGLVHDQVRGIYQHAPTGEILITTNGGVSKFDGQRFVTLPITEMKRPALPLAADGLVDAGWTLNDTDTWLSGGAGGPRRYDGKTL